MNHAAANSPVNGQRCWDRLMELAAITDPALPWTRRSFSSLFLEGRDWLRRAFEAAGLTVRVDAGGNLIGRLPGSAGLPKAILIGSHSDTVPGGGRFDGIAGVMAGLEIAACLRERGERLHHDLEIVDFLAEEPSDYGVSCVGSRAMAGELTQPMLESPNPAGETLAAAMRRVGGKPDCLGEAVRRDVAAFFELHIEQGPVLESGGIDLGIVTAIVGITRVAVTFSGVAAHAGTTPMALRQDALVAASDFVLALHAAAAELAASGRGYFVATAGRVSIRPNAANVVPGEVTLLLDLRSDRRPLMGEFLAQLQPLAAASAARFKVSLSRFERPSDTTTAQCDPLLMACLREQAQAAGRSFAEMTSGAGHDCAFLSHVGPSAMLFVPSRAGKSHCPEEWTDAAQLMAGVETLSEAVRNFDRRAAEAAV